MFVTSPKPVSINGKSEKIRTKNKSGVDSVRQIRTDINLYHLFLNGFVSVSS